MPRYRFIGDPLDGFEGPDRFEWMGVEFSRDEWADVVDPFMTAKLDGNSHFEREDEAAAGDETPPETPRKRGRPRKVA